MYSNEEGSLVGWPNYSFRNVQLKENTAVDQLWYKWGYQKTCFNSKSDSHML